RGGHAGGGAGGRRRRDPSSRGAIAARDRTGWIRQALGLPYRRAGDGDRLHAARQATTRHGSRARGANRGRFRDDAGAGRVRSRARSPVSNRGSGGSRERPRGWRSTATRGTRARGGSKEFEDLSAFSFGGRLRDGSLRRLLLGAADRVAAFS